MVEELYAEHLVERPDGVDNHEINAKDEKCTIPIIWKLFSKMSLQGKISLFGKCQFIDCHLLITDSREWYESDNFNASITPVVQIATFIFTVIMSVVTFGAYTPLGIAMCMAVSVALTAISWGIAQLGNPILSIGFTVLLAVVTIGAGLANSASSAASTTSSLATNTAGTTATTAGTTASSAVSMDMVFDIASYALDIGLKIGDAVINSAYKALVDDFIEFQESYKSRMEAIENAQDDQSNYDFITPAMMIELNSFETPIPTFPDTIIGMTLNASKIYSPETYVSKKVEYYVDGFLRSSFII